MREREHGDGTQMARKRRQNTEGKDKDQKHQKAKQKIKSGKMDKKKDDA